MSELIYNLENLDCAGCAMKIETAVAKLHEIEKVNVDFVQKKMKIITNVSDLKELEEKIKKTVTSIESDIKVTKKGDNSNKRTGKQVFSTIISLCFMSAALIASLLGGVETGISILFIGAIIFSGYDCIYGGIKSLFTLRLNEKLLMTIAIIAAAILGEFLEAAMVSVLFRIGNHLEELSLERSRKNIEALADIRPDIALVTDSEGNIIEKDARTVNIGEILTIRPGARVPLDGKVLTGESSIDTSALTGESIPSPAQKETLLFSGSLNGSGLLTMEVTNTFTDSAATRIIESVRNSAAKKGNFEKFITRFAKVYTPIVFIMALALAFIPPAISFGSYPDFIHRSLVFLVASCPCALVISVPLGFFSAVGGATKIGVLIKGGKYIEQLSKIKICAFDKTGTLTTGNLKIKKIINQSTLSDDELLKIFAACEKHSEHPIAKAIKKAVNGDIESFENYSEDFGFGVSCEKEGVKYYCGSAKYLENNQIDVSTASTANIFLGADGELLGAAVISDEIRSNIADDLKKIKKSGVSHFAILSGDSENAVKDVGTECGINDTFHSLTPDKKTETLKILKDKYGTACFIGDGINDAPVLSAADVGIAMGLGTQSAIETADAVLSSGEFSKLSHAIRFSKRAMRTIHSVIFFSLFIKAIVLALAVFNLTSMWAAVFADVGVTLISIAAVSSLLFPGKKSKI